MMLFDRDNLPEDIYKVIFPTERQQVVAHLLINKMKENGGYIGRTEMSMFATKLHDGELVDDRPSLDPLRRSEKNNLSYNKRQFYDRI